MICRVLQIIRIHNLVISTDYSAPSFSHHQPSHSNHSFMSHQSSQLAQSHLNGVNSRQPSSHFASLGSQPNHFASLGNQPSHFVSQDQSQQSAFYSLASLQHAQRAPKAFMPSTHDHYMAGGHVQQPQTIQPLASSYGGHMTTPFNGIPGMWNKNACLNIFLFAKITGIWLRFRLYCVLFQRGLNLWPKTSKGVPKAAILRNLCDYKHPFYPPLLPSMPKNMLFFEYFCHKKRRFCDSSHVYVHSMFKNFTQSIVKVFTIFIFFC